MPEYDFAEPRSPDSSRLAESTEDVLVKGVLASLDLDRVLIKLARVLSSFVGVSGLSLKLVDAAEELVLLRRGDDFKREIVYGSRILSPTSFSAQVLSSGEPAVIEDIAGTGLSLASYVAREGFKSLIAVPLASGGRDMGILTVYLGERSSVSTEILAIVSMVASVTAAAIEHSDLVRRIEKNYFCTVEALTAAIEAKDPYTRGHSKRVTQFAIMLAERFGVSDMDIRNLQYGATLHDIGKIGVRGHILNKKGRLTREEYEIIKQHPIIGERIIERVDFLQGSRPVVRSHHERFDGTGYPDGLRDQEIPFLARIAAVVDFFDALTSDRPYRQAYSVEDTNLMIREGIGREFDPTVAREFLQISSNLTKPAEVPIAIPACADV
jgi:putative nucleotidyltransferase with HDIG domain